MNVEKVIPILNVSSLQESFAWFERIGWKKAWDWGDGFGSVCSGDVEIFLCQNCQGSRGGAMPQHVHDDETGGVWLSWFVDSPTEVDAIYQLALEQGVTVTRPPMDYPWHMREFHIRHPDGHTFRVGAGIEEE